MFQARARSVFSEEGSGMVSYYCNAHSNELFRRGSRINSDQFPKQGGVSEHAFPGNTIGFNSLKSPYLGF